MTAQTSTRRPLYRAYLVVGSGEQLRWSDIGAAWMNKDGKGLSLELDAVPLTGRIVLREIDREEEPQNR